MNKCFNYYILLYMSFNLR